MYKYTYDLGILCLKPVPVGPLDFKQEFSLYLEFGGHCLVEQPAWLWEMKVLVTSRS